MGPTDVLRRASAYLERHGVESPEATAEILLMHVLGTDRTGLYRRSDGLDTAEARRFGRALCQRCTGTPLQHLTGQQAFRRLTLRVRPGVFIPRAETEVLVEHALAAIADVDRPIVVDVGTGTGAIALSIADERHDARVLATDLSPDAIALARENAEITGVSVEMHEGDLLDAIPADVRGRVDLIVSNPPYVAAEALADLPDDVRADPELALVGGISVYERLASAAVSIVRPGGALVVEIGETQADDVAVVLRGAGWTRIEVERDLTDRDRVIVASSGA